MARADRSVTDRPVWIWADHPANPIVRSSKYMCSRCGGEVELDGDRGWRHSTRDIRDV